MCGICGVALAEGSGRTLDEGRIERMRDLLTHRGPDDAGSYLAERVGLGHRRLSIVDVEAGHQPMTSEDGRFTVVYNGEIYNHPELTEELTASGVAYRTHCDTESLLRLYERAGAASVGRLRGMFAFAVWDERERSLFLARDRLGIKPLYFARLDDGSIAFASEIKALVPVLGDVEIDRGALPDYLANHATSGSRTLFRGVERLLPGHTLAWRDGRVRIERYWDVSFADTEFPSDDAAIEAFGEMFRECVRGHLMSDVPLGAFLSGGIDSAAITATMAELVDEPVRTFSVAFAEREANELRYARIVAEAFRTDHHEVVVSPEQFFERLPRLVWHEDEPIAHPSSVALHFVSELAARHVKVVLTGEGSDEVLAGYLRYPKTVMNRRLAQRWEALAPGPVRRGIARAFRALPKGSWLSRKGCRTFLVLPGDLESIYFDNFAVFSRARQAGLLTLAALESIGGVDPYAEFRDAIERCDASTEIEQLLYVDIKTYLHELLMKQDQMSMSTSLESRVPFLDHKMVELAASLPLRMKLRGRTTKFVLRRAMDGLLPPAILERPKMGFPVPIGAWFRGAYRPLVEEYVLSERSMRRGWFREHALRQLVAEHAAGIDHAERLWALVNFEIWQREFLDGEEPADVASSTAAAARRT